jgi:predicted enzyme related to lactoylglutathione lyase
MAQANTRGRFLWHELMTSDPKAALAFYTRIVGWKAQEWDKDPNYTMLLAGSGPVGGVMVLPEKDKAAGVPPNWASYIETRDLDDTLATAQRLGARVLKPASPIPEVGRFAVVQDPQGAVFVPFEPSIEMDVNDPPRPGEFSWHELITTDHEAALRFYQELFGWEKRQAMNVGAPVGVYQIFGWDGKDMGGIYTKPKDMPAPPNWLPYAMVADTRKAATEVTSAGGQVLIGPMEVPGGDLIIVGQDPQGAAFALHSAAPAGAERKEPATAGR